MIGGRRPSSADSAGVCGDDCRYRTLYEGSQRSLLDMASRQAGAVARVGRLRNQLILAAKRAFPRPFQDAERTLNRRFEDAPDEVLVAYVDSFFQHSAVVAAPGRETGADALRRALEALAIPVPDGTDLAEWAEAVTRFGRMAPARTETASPIAPPPERPRIVRHVNNDPFGNLDDLFADTADTPRVDTRGGAQGSPVPAVLAKASPTGQSAGTLAPRVDAFPQGPARRVEPEQAVAPVAFDDAVAGPARAASAPSDSDVADAGSSTLPAEGKQDGGKKRRRRPASRVEVESGDAFPDDSFATGAGSAFDRDAPSNMSPPATADAGALNIPLTDSTDAVSGPVADPDAVLDAAFDPGFDAGFDTSVDGDFGAGFDGGFGTGFDAGFDGGFDAGFDGDFGSDGPDGPEQEVAIAAVDETEGDETEGDEAEGDEAEGGEPGDDAEHLSLTEASPTRRAAASPVAEFGQLDDAADAAHVGDPMRQTPAAAPAAEHVSAGTGPERRPAAVAVPAPGAAPWASSPAQSDPAAASVEGSAGTPSAEVRWAPRPAFKPQLFPTASKPSRNRGRSRDRVSRALPPDSMPDITIDQPPGTPVELTDDVRSRLLALSALPRPVFTSDLASQIGSADLVEAWQREWRSGNLEVRFILPKPRDRARGALVAPIGHLASASNEFLRSWWAPCVENFRGAKLYQLGVFFHRFGDSTVSHSVGQELVLARLSTPSGLVAAVIVVGQNLAPGGATRDQLCSTLEQLFTERLVQIAVLAVSTEQVAPIVELIDDEARSRSWHPAAPVTLSKSWEYAAGTGTAVPLLGI